MGKATVRYLVTLHDSATEERDDVMVERKCIIVAYTTSVLMRLYAIDKLKKRATSVGDWVGHAKDAGISFTKEELRGFATVASVSQAQDGIDVYAMVDEDVDRMEYAYAKIIALFVEFLGEECAVPMTREELEVVKTSREAINGM